MVKVEKKQGAVSNLITIKHVYVFAVLFTMVIITEGIQVVSTYNAIIIFAVQDMVDYRDVFYSYTVESILGNVKRCSDSLHNTSLHNISHSSWSSMRPFIVLKSMCRAFLIEFIGSCSLITCTSSFDVRLVGAGRQRSAC